MEEAEQARSKKVVLYGTGQRAGARPLQEPVRAAALVHHARSRASIPWLERRHTEAESDRAREQIEGYMREVPCPACDGARLRPASLAVTIGDTNIYEVGELSIRKAAEFLGALELSERDRLIAERVLKEVNERLRFLLDVGLDYLTSTARRARSPAARRSASGWRRRSAAASSACSTCSTSRRSACTSATTSA